MNLLVVSSWMPYPPDNGSQIRAYQLLRRLGSNHRVTLLAFATPAHPPDVEPLRTLCERVHVIEPTRVQGRLGFRGLLSPLPRHYVQTTSPAMQRAVDEALTGQDAAIGLAIAAARYLASAASALPVMFEEAEVSVFRDRVVFARDARSRARHTLTWWKYRRLVKALASQCAMTTVVSEREHQALVAMGCDAERLAVVPNGVEMLEAMPGGTRVRRLIYPGSVAYDANLDAVRHFVVEIFPLIRLAHPDMQFTVTGTTDGAQVDDLVATPGVSFTGRVPDVTPLIVESTACVVPLRIGGGTRLKILHAMAAGTPVVSTTKGMEGLAVEPDRHLLVADSPSTFAAQVIRLIDDQALGQRLALAALDRVRERYDWETVAATLERVLERAVARHSHRPGTGK